MEKKLCPLSICVKFVFEVLSDPLHHSVVKMTQRTQAYVVWLPAVTWADMHDSLRTREQGNATPAAAGV